MINRGKKYFQHTSQTQICLPDTPSPLNFEGKKEQFDIKLGKGMNRKLKGEKIQMVLIMFIKITSKNQAEVILVHTMQQTIYYQLLLSISFSKLLVQISNLTVYYFKRKQTHRYREQTRVTNGERKGGRSIIGVAA